jgi:hypothetical protein
VTIPRSPLDGRYLTTAEKHLLVRRANVTFANIRSWQGRYALRGEKMRQAHARIDAVVGEIVAARVEMKMDGEDEREGHHEHE